MRTVKRLRRTVAWLCLCATVLLALLCVPAVALAKDYEVSRVDIDATLGADGSLSVTEQRTYRFSGSFNGIYWDVPRGTYEGRSIDTQVVSVAAQMGDKQVTFTQVPSELVRNYELAGTYELTEQRDCLHLKLYWPVTSMDVTYQVVYQMPNLATRWADVGELYWQYVPADEGSGGEWRNVTATIHLPVPKGEPIKPGDNVCAWGHGPLDGEVRFDGADVVFFSPGVGAAEYLEARVTCPASWLKEVRGSEQVRLDAILAEEEQWVKDANRARLYARLGVYGIPASLVLVGVGSVVAAILGKRYRKAKMPKAQFSEKYYRDVPTDDHPAVLGKLYRDGYVRNEDFSATIMSLVNAGRVSVDTVTVEERGRRGRMMQKSQWRLLLTGGQGSNRHRKSAADAKAIDNAAYAFLYYDIADKHKHTIDENLVGPKGEPYVLMSFFDETAKSWPQAYETGYNRWHDAVTAAFDARCFATRRESSLFPGVLGLAVFALAVILCMVGALAGSPSVPLTVAFVLCFACGIYVIMSDEDEPQLTFSQEAAEIKAKLQALKRWLEDFTRLEEAVPTDVVLWNRLLVMATVLGVADKVVQQLKVAAPQLVANPAFVGYAWYGGDGESKDNQLANALERSVYTGCSTSRAKLHHDVSSSDVASSHDSSYSGGGGGFSGGGGGGFSGGGRGGAF